MACGELRGDLLAVVHSQHLPHLFRHLKRRDGAVTERVLFIYFFHHIKISTALDGLFHTQTLHLLHHLLPHRFNVDAAEAPVRGDLYQVRSPVAVGHHIVYILVKVQDVLAVGKVPLVLAAVRKVEEGLLKVKGVMAMAIVTAAVRLSVFCLPITVIIASLVFIGQDLSTVTTFIPGQKSLTACC